jgi:putative membrane protein
MERRARDRVTELTTVLTVISLALVFGAVRGVVPASALPHWPSVLSAIPHVNTALSLVAVVVLVGGVYSIRQGRVGRHRAAMVTVLALFALFLVLYLYRVAIEGPHPFPGPDPVYQFVYLPLLAVHILFAVVTIPLLYYVLLLALTRTIPELRETAHRRVGRLAASLWLVSFVLGIVVYTLLYVVY